MDTIGIKTLRRDLTTISEDIYHRRTDGLVLTSNGTPKAVLLPCDRQGQPFIPRSIDGVVFEVEMPERDAP